MKPGPKKALLLSAILLAGLGAWFGWKAMSPQEPVYKGHPLTFWVEQWALHPVAREEAYIAIQEIGTNGIPFLLGRMRTTEPAIKAWLRAKAPLSWRSHLHLENTSEQQKSLGAFGLTVLGTNAGPAVPELMKLLSLEMNRNPPDRTSGDLLMLE